MDLRNTGKILYVTSYDVTVVNGPGVNEREFVGALHRRLGDRAHFVLPRPRNPEVEIPPATFTRGFDTYSAGPYLLNEFSQMRVAGRLLATREYDLVVFRLGLLPLSATWLTTRYRVPYAVKTLSIGVFDGFRMQSGLMGLVGPALAPLNEVLFRRILRKAVAVDTCTDADVAYFSQRFSLPLSQLRKVENATNTERFRPGDKLEARRLIGLERFDPLVGYVGGRPEMRGAVQLLEIAPRLFQEFPDAGIVVVGDGKAMPELRARAAELEQPDRFVFTGLVPYEEVHHYINALDVGVAFELKENIERIGNSCQKVYQYVSCGIPVVAAPGGNEFLIEERLGSIVESDDYVSVYDAVAAWLRRAETREHSYRSRAADYASTALSVDGRMEERLRFWTERLGGRPDPAGQPHHTGAG